MNIFMVTYFLVYILVFYYFRYRFNDLLIFDMKHLFYINTDYGLMKDTSVKIIKCLNIIHKCLNYQI